MLNQARHPRWLLQLHVQLPGLRWLKSLGASQAFCSLHMAPPCDQLGFPQSLVVSGQTPYTVTDFLQNKHFKNPGRRGKASQELTLEITWDHFLSSASPDAVWEGTVLHKSPVLGGVVPQGTIFGAQLPHLLTFSTGKHLYLRCGRQLTIDQSEELKKIL